MKTMTSEYTKIFVTCLKLDPKKISRKSNKRNTSTSNFPETSPIDNTTKTGKFHTRSLDINYEFNVPKFHAPFS